MGAQIGKVGVSIEWIETSMDGWLIEDITTLRAYTGFQQDVSVKK